MVIYVDIDGTLTVESDGYGYKTYLRRTPNHSVIYKINSLSEDGHKIVIWTARFEEDRPVTTLWLDIHCVLYDELIMGKPSFDLYICDKVKNVIDL